MALCFSLVLCWCRIALVLCDRGNSWNRSLGATSLPWTLVLYSFLSPDEKGEIWKGDAFVASLMVDQTVNFFSLTSEELT